MYLYSNNNDFLPGMCEWVIYDHESDPDITFEEETAGFSSHPIFSMTNESDQNNNQVLLENMGMSDPECVHINGRTFTAAALWNLCNSKQNKSSRSCNSSWQHN